MICHLTDAFCCPLGERVALSGQRPAYPYPGLQVARPLLSQEVAAGVPTPPIMDQQIGGTPPGEFAADRDALLVKIDQFCQATGPWSPHPMFGAMTTVRVDALGLSAHGPPPPPVRTLIPQRRKRHLTPQRRTSMPQSPHDRAAEYHNLAAHAHAAAAASHGKGSLTAHELSRQAHEHSTRAFEESRKATEEFGESPAEASKHS